MECVIRNDLDLAGFTLPWIVEATAYLNLKERYA
jgi:hypothetical protein